MERGSLPSDVVRVASRYFEGLGTPIALSAAIKLRLGLWDEISDVSLDPRNYLEHQSNLYCRDAMAVGLLKKLEELPGTHDRRANAVAKWYAGEAACYRTNQRLTRYLPEFRNSSDRVEGVARFTAVLRKIIVELIGARPPDLTAGRFGPGTTFSDRGWTSTVPHKMSSDPSLTRNAWPYLPQWLGTAWGSYTAERGGELCFVPGNRFATVPKTAKTDRAIAAEPSINVFYQLGLGRVIRQRLRNRTGWDLNTAQDTHRRVAEESSLTREFATLDLSNASDTVAYNLVRLLLPRCWFEALDGLRSPKTLIDDRWVVLEKFSSMGNGFTFELETVIFAALAMACSRELGFAGKLGYDVFVFGDDIIVKNDVYRTLKSVLEFYGFELNKEKSFFGEVPFRESCGGDYFAGEPVRPFHLKQLPSEPPDYFAFANGLKRAMAQLAPFGCDAKLDRVWFAVLDSIPLQLREIRGPQALGDIVLWDDDQHRWPTRVRNGIRYLKALKPGKLQVVRFSWFDPEVVLACATYGTGNYGTPANGVSCRVEGVIPRDAVRGYKVGRVPWS